MVNPHEVCVALRSYRIRGRIRQQIIADILGVAQSQISRWESGRDIPRPHNIEAIRTLVWGSESAELQALMAFVRSSDAPLVLSDAEHRTLALSRPFDAPGSDWRRFGWALRPQHNAAAVAIESRLRREMDAPRGVVSLELQVPFSHGGLPWIASVRKTIHAINGQAICLSEVRFAPDDPSAPLLAASLRRLDVPALA